VLVIVYLQVVGERQRRKAISKLFSTC